MSDETEMSGFVDLEFVELSEEDMDKQASDFYELMNKRRTTRHFSDRKVSKKLIEYAIKTAGTAPSGAHLQPWTFIAISNNDLKNKIRQAAEDEEKKTRLTPVLLQRFKTCLNPSISFKTFTGYSWVL